MINRLPKKYRVDVAPAGAAPASASAPGLAGERQSLSNKIMEAAANCVGTHPMASLGAAFVTGILLGKWVKR